MRLLLQPGGFPTKARESVLGHTFAYLRVSKAEQDLEKNKMDILKLAHKQRLGQLQFIEEKVSGKVSWRKRQIAMILIRARNCVNMARK